jgi:hypothetical protein
VSEISKHALQYWDNIWLLEYYIAGRGLFRRACKHTRCVFGTGLGRKRRASHSFGVPVSRSVVARTGRTSQNHVLPVWQLAELTKDFDGTSSVLYVGV